MSNLEPGCKAIIVRGRNKENLGKIVTVGKYKGEVRLGGLWSGRVDLWEVDTPILFRCIQWSRYFKFASESTMQRIDGNDNETIETKKELEVKV